VRAHLAECSSEELEELDEEMRDQEQYDTACFEALSKF
jgi:hypothetical protein